MNHERCHHPITLVQRRMWALWLESNNLPRGLIAELVGVTENALFEYFQLFVEGGVEELKEVDFYQPDGALVEHTTSLEAYFRDHSPATIKEAQSEIETLTGIKRSETQVAALLKKTPSSLPQSQNDFSESRSGPTDPLSGARNRPRIAEAQAGKRAVFFVYAVHFVLAPFSDFFGR